MYFKESDKVVCVIDIMGLYDSPDGVEIEELYSLFPNKKFPEIGKVYCVEKVDGNEVYLVGFEDQPNGFLCGLFMEIKEFQRMDSTTKKVYLSHK